MMARFKRRIGLQTDDDFAVAVDVAGVVRDDGGRQIGRHVEHTAVGLFLLDQFGYRLPHRLGARGRAGEEAVVADVGRVVLDDEVTNIDFGAPRAFAEPFPRVLAGHHEMWCVHWFLLFFGMQINR
jgi:hypothetical protein